MKKRKPAGEGASSRPSKKKAVEQVSEPEESSNHVSSPDPLHTAEPLEDDAQRLEGLRHHEDEFHLAVEDQIANAGNNPPVQQGENPNALVISIPSHTTFPSGLLNFISFCFPSCLNLFLHYLFFCFVVNALNVRPRSLANSSGPPDEAESAFSCIDPFYSYLSLLIFFP